MRQIILFLLLIPVILTGCANTADVGETELTVTSAFELTSLTPMNSVSCTAFYDNQFYYVQAFRDNFTIRRLDLEGNETLNFDIPRGNGPGEARHSLGITINEKGIYFSDFALRRISIFDFDGNYQDCMDFSDETGIVVYFDIMGNYMYTDAIDTIYLGKIDLNTGEQVASIPREGKTKHEEGSFVSGGIITCDPYNSEIYVGGIGAPYKIERFNTDLKKLGEYTYKLEPEYKPVKIYPGPNIAGDFTVASMAVTKDHIYAPHISARLFLKNNRGELEPFVPEIFRFNKKTGKIDHKYSIKGIPEMEGGFTVVSVDEEKVVGIVSGGGDWVKYIYPENTPSETESLIIMKKQ